MKLRKGDPVRVITGKDKGKDGVVEHVYPKDNKVIVRREWARDGDRIKGAFAIARDLAEQVKAVSAPPAAG